MPLDKRQKEIFLQNLNKFKEQEREACILIDAFSQNNSWPDHLTKGQIVNIKSWRYWNKRMKTALRGKKSRLAVLKILSNLSKYEKSFVKSV